jgi:hypothetical protein
MRRRISGVTTFLASQSLEKFRVDVGTLAVYGAHEQPFFFLTGFKARGNDFAVDSGAIPPFGILFEDLLYRLRCFHERLQGPYVPWTQRRSKLAIGHSIRSSGSQGVFVLGQTGY